MKYKINQKVLFKTKPLLNLNCVVIGSSEAIGIIKDFDGDFCIIENGAGENYILIKDILKVLKWTQTNL